MENLADIFDDFAPQPDQQWYSVGFACGLIQVSPPQLRTLMEAAEVKFDKCLNGVAYLRGDAFAKVMSACHDVRKEIESVSRSAASN